MKHLAILLALVSLGSYAQGFQDEPTCYSWSGGHKSSGSFSKCGSELQALAKKPEPPVVAPTPVAVLAPAPVAAPIPPQIVTCVFPEPAKPAPAPFKPRPKAKPKQTC